MTNRAPKVARLVPIDTPDNSSSDSESETEREGKEIQVEFEARSPEEEDYHGIRRLLQQLFLRNQVVNVNKVAETILGRSESSAAFSIINIACDSAEIHWVSHQTVCWRRQ